MVSGFVTCDISSRLGQSRVIHSSSARSLAYSRRRGELIFLVHSMGGLVVRDYLLSHRDWDRYVSAAGLGDRESEAEHWRELSRSASRRVKDDGRVSKGR
jgi:hypothetical protein